MRWRLTGLPWEGNFHSHSHPIPTRFLWESPWGYPYGSPYGYLHMDIHMEIHMGISIWGSPYESPYGDIHMEIHMGIPTGENHIPIPIPFPWVWGSIWGFPYPRQPWRLERKYKISRILFRD